MCQWNIKVPGKVITNERYASLISDLVKGLGRKASYEIDEYGNHVLYLPGNLVTDSLKVGKRIVKLIRQHGVHATLERIDNQKTGFHRPVVAR